MWHYYLVFDLFFKHFLNVSASSVFLFLKCCITFLWRSSQPRSRLVINLHILPTELLSRYFSQQNQFIITNSTGERPNVVCNILPWNNLAYLWTGLPELTFELEDCTYDANYTNYNKSSNKISHVCKQSTNSLLLAMGRFRETVIRNKIAGHVSKHDILENN